MARTVSVRDLRNDTAGVVAAVEAGEDVTLTVNRRPVADIVPHREPRSPWVPSSVLLEFLENAASDPTFFDDIADVRNELVD